MCHVVYQYERANNNYMKDFDPRKEFSYLMYWDVNNLYEQCQRNYLWVVSNGEKTYLGPRNG